MLIYAHRGARGYAPENTMAAFKKALSLGADGIELDVQRTKDGEIVICHDHTVDRTSDGHGWIKNFTLARLKALDFGGWFSPNHKGETIPTLAEFLDWYKDTSLYLNIEIKNGPVLYSGIEQDILELIKHILPDWQDMLPRIILSSFYHPSLSAVKDIDARFATGLLYSSRPMDPVRLAKEIDANYLHPHWHYLDPIWVKAALDAGIGVNAYTVNTQEELSYIRQFQLNGIFSDFPDRASAF
jgi:glycerophosphoryl diester phosphodiesterase